MSRLDWLLQILFDMQAFSVFLFWNCCLSSLSFGRNLLQKLIFSWNSVLCLSHRVLLFGSFIPFSYTNLSDFFQKLFFKCFSFLIILYWRKFDLFVFALSQVSVCINTERMMLDRLIETNRMLIFIYNRNIKMVSTWFWRYDMTIWVWFGIQDWNQFGWAMPLFESVQSCNATPATIFIRFLNPFWLGYALFVSVKCFLVQLNSIVFVWFFWNGLAGSLDKTKLHVVLDFFLSYAQLHGKNNYTKKTMINSYSYTIAKTWKYHLARIFLVL